MRACTNVIKIVLVLVDIINSCYLCLGLHVFLDLSTLGYSGLEARVVVHLRWIEDLERVVHWWSRGYACWWLASALSILIEVRGLRAKCFALFSHLQVPAVLEVGHVR